MNQIKQFRKSLGLTQVQLSKRLGVSFATINRWENNHHKPSPLALKLIKGDISMTTQKDSIKDLITRCHDTDLDDIVHDLKSQEASDINNGGAKAQIDYIIQVYGEETGIKIIEDAIS